MFAEERPRLRSLSLQPFRYSQDGNRSVHLDGCVEVAAAYYGVAPGWISRDLRRRRAPCLRKMELPDQRQAGFLDQSVYPGLQSRPPFRSNARRGWEGANGQASRQAGHRTRAPR